MRAEDRYDSLLQWHFAAVAASHGFDEGVDWRLAKAQMLAESGGDPRAVSPVGARGLFQLMPGTWGAGFEADWANPESSIAKGLLHLGYCWSIFQAEDGLERWKFALGAYNAGQGHIIAAQRILAGKKRATDQWNEVAVVLPEITGEHATETITYVRHIMADFLAAHGPFTPIKET